MYIYLRLIGVFGSCERFHNVRAGWACWYHPYIYRESIDSLILRL